MCWISKAIVFEATVLELEHTSEDMATRNDLGSSLLRRNEWVCKNSTGYETSDAMKTAKKSHLQSTLAAASSQPA
jgi:hypothetical protein